MKDYKQINLMEVCGTHTMAIAKAGIKEMLPENVKLLSGPGCPVCVTTQEDIDVFLELSMRPGVVITTYGDMIRVPGSRQGDNLAARRALGADVRVVYSPVDAVEIAASCPDKQVVFLGVGFETTAPGTAAAVGMAAAKGLGNFSVYSMLKKVEPALRALINDSLFNVQGFIVPGHVAVIIGEEGFRFLEKDYHIPSVITGFEAADIWKSINRLIDKVRAGDGTLENAYTRLVRPAGNSLALDAVDKFFEPSDAVWRGLGFIEKSGLALRAQYEDFDAVKKFGLAASGALSGSSVGAAVSDGVSGGAASGAASYDRTRTGSARELCRCGEIIKGLMEPSCCPLFGTACTPEDPVGPCMVSSEGACAASWRYRKV